MQPGQPEPHLTNDCKVMDGIVTAHSLPTEIKWSIHKPVCSLLHCINHIEIWPQCYHL